MDWLTFPPRVLPRRLTMMEHASAVIMRRRVTRQDSREFDPLENEWNKIKSKYENDPRRLQKSSHLGLMFPRSESFERQQEMNFQERDLWKPYLLNEHTNYLV
ncbi:hypothetical protein CDAR_252491 [Caerostris darwini]|uniref:Uncharacterized protein n=1 Tax=Caerostris darwini TaxID=1538125 RepID=A0AAV4WHH4_9ARAC|nr:hypothetical protein CDAR_252491 [Caerostris darwini]